MTEKDEYLSIIVMSGGDRAPRTYSVSRRRIRAFKVLGVVLVAGILGMAGSWVSIAQRAARVSVLTQENDSLLARHGRLDSLVRRLASVEARQDNVQLLLGIAGPRDSTFWRGSQPTVTTGAGVRQAEATGSEPRAWPLTAPGAITQSGGSDGSHPGIDIAIPSDSYVLASGGGEVVDAANDPVYGLFVLIDHGNGWRSRYGHASYLVAERGRTVRRGEVIALSGSTGRSTAPHLHFEILQNGRPVDPLSMVTPP